MSTPKSTATKIRAVLLDLSGTLHIGSSAIPGAVQAIAKLQQQQDTTNNKNRIKIRVLTNTSTVSSKELQRQLKSMGFDFDDASQIYTSVLAVKSYLQQPTLTTQQQQRRPYLLLEDDVLEDFKCTSTNDNSGIPLDPPHNCVVVGLAPSKCNYANLDQAFSILQQPGSELIAMHRSTFVKTETGTKSLGPGAFVAALEAAVPECAPATILGKPCRAFYENVLLDLNVPAEAVCMVGDDIVGDIYGAQEAGIGTTLLVQTGKYEPGDEWKQTLQNPDEQPQPPQHGPPTKVVPSIVEAVQYILENV